jgi:hypothetical protein
MILAVEDEISEAVLRELIRVVRPELNVVNSIGMREELSNQQSSRPQSHGPLHSDIFDDGSGSSFSMSG